MRTWRAHPARIAAAIGLAAFLFLLLSASAAGAAISGPCPVDQNYAIIEGVKYTAANDTADNPVVVQAGEELQIEYLGTTTAAITDHMGQIAIPIGPADFVVEPWSSPNKPMPKLAKEGTYSFDVPDIVGIFDITGFHEGTGGRCDGNAVLKIEGKNAFTTPVGGGAVGGTVLAAIGVGFAAVSKKGVA